MSKCTSKGRHDLNRYLVLLGLVALVLVYGAATNDRESVRTFIQSIGASLALVLARYAQDWRRARQNPARGVSVGEQGGPRRELVRAPRSQPHTRTRGAPSRAVHHKVFNHESSTGGPSP